MEFTERLIFAGFDARDRAEALERMARRLVETGYVKESFVRAVAEREANFATGLALGTLNVAIPHTDVEHVLRPAICVAVLKEEVRFGTMGDDENEIPVKLIFMLAMEEPHAQLAMLQKLVTFFQNETYVKRIAEETDTAAICHIITREIDSFAN